MDTQSKPLAQATALFATGLLASALLVTALPASAAKVGYYGVAEGQGQPHYAAPITAAGHTPVNLSTLSASDLAGVDVLFALHAGGQYPQGFLDAASTTIAAAVRGGMVLCFADRVPFEAPRAPQVLPGGAGITLVRRTDEGGQTPLDADKNIDVLDSTTLLTNGPGGIVTDANLDGGNFSNHGFAASDSLPIGSRVILDRAANQAVTFSYPHGHGAVVYSTVPLDAYLEEGADFGPPSANFKNIYAPNLVAYCASLAARSSLGPISLRFCHSAGHGGDPACLNGAGLPTTGNVASVIPTPSACQPGQPTKGTANVSVTPGDYVTVSWNDLNCGSNDGSQSIRVNPIIRDTVGIDVKLHADAPNALVRLRVFPRDGEDDDMCEEDERPARAKRIVVETLHDGRRLESRTINGDERIDVRIANSVPDEVITSAAVKFWVGRRITGAKTIIAKAFRNGEPVGVERRVLLAVPRTTFSEVQVYTPANFGNNAFDKIEFRAAPGSWFGLGSADLQTTRSSP